MATAEIVKEFVELVDTNVDYDLKDLKAMLDEIYKTKTGKKVTKPRAKKAAKAAKAANADNDDTESDEEPPKEAKKKTAKGTKAAKAAKADKMDEDKPKRAPTAYNLFIKERIAQIKDEQPDVPAKSRLSVAAADWKNLSQEEKDKYKPEP